MGKPKGGKQSVKPMSQRQQTQLDEADAKASRGRNKIIFGKLEPRTPKQAELMRLIDSKRLVFVKGPAGCGKTFVPTSMAAEALIEERIERIIITRPMVGCDEDMGFMPGTEEEKYAGWVEPFLDVLEGKLGKSRVATMIKYGEIIAKPLMRMRGSTLRNAMVILDEAQNTTENQMKMFLTRCGPGTRIIVNGDVEQSDLPHQRNGLVDALDILSDSPDIGIMEFTEDDVVRDRLVRAIVKAYRSKYVKRTLERMGAANENTAQAIAA